MFALTKPPPNGLSVLIHFTRWPIMQKVHRYFAGRNIFKMEKAFKINFRFFVDLAPKIKAQ